MWITAFFYRIFGVGEFAARLFSALCGVGSVMLTYLIGRRLLSRWAGFLGALVLLSSSHFIRFARFGMLDAPLTFFLSLTLYLFWLGRHRNRYLIFSGIALGVAFMIKGFAAFLVFPVIIVYALWAGEREILTRSSYWIGVMIAVAIALPWNAYEMITNQNAFMKDVVIKHLFSRTTTALEGHAGNAYFYIRTLINKYHPWILVGVASGPWFLWKAAKNRDPENVFLASWMFVILAIVTLVRTKLPWYLMPVYPALSLTVGYVLAQIFKDRYRVAVSLAFVAVMGLHVHFSNIFNADYSRDIKGLSAAVRSQVPADKPVYLYLYHESPAAIFYLNRRVGYIDTPEELRELSKKGPFYLLIHDAKAPDMSAASRPSKELAHFEALKLVKF